MEVKELNKKQLIIILSLIMVIIAESVYIARIENATLFTDVTDGGPHAAIMIRDLRNDSGILNVGVQNVGGKTVTLSTIFINGTTRTFSNSSSLTLTPTNETWLTTSFPKGSATVEVNVVCTDGTHAEVTQTFP